MREITIDLDHALDMNEPVGYQIAKKLTISEIEQYKAILGLTNHKIKSTIRDKKNERIELFEAVVRAYPIIAKRPNGESEYLRKNLATCLSLWKKATGGDIKKEYLILQRLHDYIHNTDPKYIKKLSNWLKEVVVEPEDESKIFSQEANIMIL
jgi:hypothetical protein